MNEQRDHAKQLRIRSALMTLQAELMDKAMPRQQHNLRTCRFGVKYFRKMGRDHFHKKLPEIERYLSDEIVPRPERQWMLRLFRSQTPSQFVTRLKSNEQLLKKIKVLFRNIKKRIRRRTAKSSDMQIVEQYRAAKSSDMRIAEEYRPVKPKVLYWSSPLCPKKCGEHLQDKKCPQGNHIKVQCPKCEWSAHKCPQNDNSQPQKRQKLDLRLTGRRLPSQKRTLQSIKPTSSLNNLQNILKKKGYCYVDELMCVSELPPLTCSYPILPPNIVAQIMRNRTKEKFLPLSIKQSQLPGAGLGVFAEQNIPEGMIICSYLAQIGLGSYSLYQSVQTSKGEVQMPNNSLFTLGWVQNEDILMIKPDRFSNIGRFFNSRPSQQCNIYSQLAAIEGEGNKNNEICVYFVSSRKIKKGEELCYDYGKDYNLDNQ